MRETFCLEDLFDVMIELEGVGQAHYVKMQKWTDDETARQLFAHLAEQEADHQKLYRTLKTQYVAFGENAALEPSYSAYVKALLTQTMTFLKEAGAVEDYASGLACAVQLEKDTLLFLNEMKLIIGEGGADAIDAVILQEKMHLKALYELQL